MPSMAGQSRLVWRGALLAVMIGSGWGCGKLVGADFDKPLTTGGAGGAGGADGASAQSTATTGSQATSTDSSSSSTASSSGAGGSTSGSGMASSSSASAGGGGADDCIQQGNCPTNPVYVVIESEVDLCVSDAKDVVMSNDDSIIKNDYRLVSQFNVFKTPHADTTALNTCTMGKDHIASLGDGPPCMPNAPGFTTLGYVSTVPLSNYTELTHLAVGMNQAFVLHAPFTDHPCCHHKSMCDDNVKAYVLPLK